MRAYRLPGWTVSWLVLLLGGFHRPALATDILVINEGSDQKITVGYLTARTSASLREKGGPAVARTTRVKVGEACFVDPASWKVTGSVPLGPDPIYGFLSPDGARAYVVSAGVKDADLADSSGQGSLTIIGLDSRNTVARIGLGYRPESVLFAPDSAWLAFVGLGGVGHEAVATFVDLREHRLMGRTRLPDSTRGVELSRDGHRLYAIAALGDEGSGPANAGLVRAFDAGTREAVADVRLGGVPKAWALTPDGRWLYVLESRAAKGVPETDTTLVLSVMDTGMGALAAGFPLGSALGPMGMDALTGSFCVCGRSAGPDKQWRLLVVNGDSLRAGVPLEREPKRLDVAPGGRRVFVGYGGNLALVDLVEGREQAVVDLGLTPADVHLRDGKCIVVVGQGGTKVAIVDVEHDAAVTRINTGRHGFKLASQFLMAGAMAAGDAYVGSINAGYRPPSSMIPLGGPGLLVPNPLHGMGPRHGSVSFSPDGETYFVFDVETNDVTVVDVDGRRKTKTIPVGSSAGGSQLHELAVVGGRWFVVSRKGGGGHQTLGIVDLERQQRVNNIKLKVEATPGRMIVDAAHDRVLVPIGKGLQVLRVSTAKHEALVKLDHPRFALVPAD